MTQKIDLGRCLFHASDSHIQLQFAAAAHFNQPTIHLDTRPLVQISQWQDLLSIWVTEAPELELRLSVGMAPGLELAASRFLSSLEEKLCSSSVWLDLGFAIRFKSCDSVRDSDNQETYRLTFGLCRGHKTSHLIRGRALPAILRDPPDAHPPPDVPTIFLASIDILLEYGYSPKAKDSFCNCLRYKSGFCGELQPPVCHAAYPYPPMLKTFELTNLALSTNEPQKSSVNQSTYSCGTTLNLSTPEDETTNKLLQAFFLLLDFGLQKLIVSASTKNTQIKVIGKDTLKGLPNLAPVIFNPLDREAMNQRAVSIPIISKAIASMLANSDSSTLQSKVSTLPRRSSHSPGDTSSPHPQTPTLKSTIQTSLWRIAQHRTCKPKAAKRPASFFVSDQTPEQPTTRNEAVPMTAHEEDESTDHELLDLDMTENDDEDDELLIDSDSESTFEDLYESTQTTMDGFSPDFECPLSPSSDVDMLLFDCDNMTALID